MEFQAKNISAVERLSSVCEILSSSPSTVTSKQVYK